MEFLSYDLKRASLEDYNSFYEIRAEKSNLFWTGYDKAPDYVSFLEWYKSRLKDEKRHLYLLFNNQICIGSLNIDFYSTYAFIGYSIKEEFTGNGLGTLLVQKAIKIINKNSEIKIIKAWINYQNIGSIKVVEKNGFVKSNISENRIRLGKVEQYFQFVLTTP